MHRIIFTALAFSLFLASGARAQTAFWSFDENNQESYIPAQCDGQFDEAHGGVFMPTPEELYDQGELFLLEKGNTRNNAGYCLLASAIQGNVKAQYRVAQLYNKGIVLPQNDLVAYRWAFLASLNGSKEAEQLALTLEQVLSADEIKLATQSLEPMLPTLKQEKSDSLQEQEALLAEKKAQLEELNKEIDEMLGVDFTPPEIKVPVVNLDSDSADESANESQIKNGAKQKESPKASESVAPAIGSASSNKPIFNENDRLK